MRECIISLGLVNKKLLIPIIYIILYCFVNIYENHIADDSGEYGLAIFYIEGFGMKIAEVKIFFIANKFRYSSYQKKVNKIQQQNYLKDFSILFLLNVIYMADELSPFYLKQEDEKKDDSSRELYLNYAIEIIIFTLATYFILKYKYYKHHFISIAIMAFLCIITDIILKNFSQTNIYIVISSITYILTNTFLYNYFKYLIDFKYYYLDILFIYGIFCFICYFLSFIIIIIIHRSNGSYEIYKEFYYFYNEKGVLYMIFRFIIFGLLLQGFVADILEFLILDKLSPIYIIIGFEMGMIPSNIIANEDSNRLLVLIVSVLQFLSLLFYLEILEFNFCSLNENTQKNIKERELSETDISDKIDEVNNCEIDGGYFLTVNDKGNEIEMEMFDELNEE